MIPMQKTIPLYVRKDHTLRVKIIDACGMTCTFCHNEGTPVTSDNIGRKIGEWTGAGRSGRVSIYLATNGARFLPSAITPDAEFQRALILLHESLNVHELHLTGGEPTLHPQLPKIVQVARLSGYQVCMTSNGENGSRAIPSCAEAGLDRINFSIFGTTAEELAQVQHRKYQNKHFAEFKIQALRQSIQVAINHKVKVNANIVVPSYDHALRVKRLLEEYSPELSVRLLNSLNDGKPSIDAICQILEDLKAEPITRYITAGVSGSRTAYRLPSGRIIYFKQIRPVRLPDTCSKCRFNNDADCQEGFYGVRLYRSQNGEFQVGVCIHRMDLCMPLEQFINSDLRKEILELREKEYNELVKKEEHE